MTNQSKSFWPSARAWKILGIAFSILAFLFIKGVMRATQDARYEVPRDAQYEASRKAQYEASKVAHVLTQARQVRDVTPDPASFRLVDAYIRWHGGGKGALCFEYRANDENGRPYSGLAFFADNVGHVKGYSLTEADFGPRWTKECGGPENPKPENFTAAITEPGGSLL